MITEFETKEKGVDELPNLSPDEIKRYSRHLIMPGSTPSTPPSAQLGTSPGGGGSG